jgi:hypothetical protein
LTFDLENKVKIKGIPIFWNFSIFHNFWTVLDTYKILYTLIYLYELNEQKENHFWPFTCYGVFHHFAINPCEQISSMSCDPC